MSDHPLPEVVAVAASSLEVSVTAEVSHLCPFVDEVDEGTVAVTWIADLRTFELHSLQAYLASFAEVRVSHEVLVEQVCTTLERLLGRDYSIGVVGRFTTAGMQVVVRR